MANRHVSHVQKNHVPIGGKESSGAALFGATEAITRTKSQLPVVDSRGEGAIRCREKFLRFFPDGFQDETYVDWERSYKVNAHEKWTELLNRATYRSLMQ